MQRMMMRGVLAALVMTAPAVMHAQGDAQKILRQMDAAAARFQSATANFKWDSYERVVRETTTQTGTIVFQRKGSSTDMGATIVAPAKKQLSYTGGKFQMYEPNIDQLTVASSGKNQAQYESFLTLGFGGSGADLEKQWTVSYQGAETIDGVQTAKLDLVPKQESVKNMFAHVIIWVDGARGVSLKQQFFTPSGDQRIAFYTDIKLNGKVDPKAFAIKTTSKTTVKNL